VDHAESFGKKVEKAKPVKGVRVSAAKLHDAKGPVAADLSDLPIQGVEQGTPERGIAKLFEIP
jgi:hypothetical protein